VARLTTNSKRYDNDPPTSEFCGVAKRFRPTWLGRLAVGLFSEAVGWRRPRIRIQMTSHQVYSHSTPTTCSTSRRSSIARYAVAMLRNAFARRIKLLDTRTIQYIIAQT